MECAGISGAGKPLVVAKKPIPDTPDKGMVLKTAFAGICHTDIHFIDDELNFGNGKIVRHRDVLGDRFIGSVPGHEIAGTVHSIGKSADTDLKVGDRVIIYPWVGCQDCSICRNGESNLCENNQGTTTDYGKGRDGGYSTHVSVPTCSLAVKIPDEFPLDVACMLPCSAVTAYGALLEAKDSVQRALTLRNKASLLVIGVGGLGLWAVALAKKALNAESLKIIAADVTQDKVDTAISKGADCGVVLDPKLTNAEKLAKIKAIESEGVSAAIDFVGLPEKTTIIGFDSLHRGGTVVCIGFYGGSMSLSVPTLIARTLSIKGVRVSSIGRMREVVDISTNPANGIKFPPIEFTSLDKVNETIEKLKQGKLTGRAVIKF